MEEHHAYNFGVSKEVNVRETTIISFSGGRLDVEFIRDGIRTAKHTMTKDETRNLFLAMMEDYRAKTGLKV